MSAAANRTPGDTFLRRMARNSRERVRQARRNLAEGSLLTRAMAMPAPPPLILSSFSVIAEIKRRSPAAGSLATDRFDGDDQARAYAAGGAAAVSVLTEPAEFRGSLEDLRRTASLLGDRGVPAMRKDFIVDPYQVMEARAAGAGGVLVIVTMLDDANVAELLACAAQCGLFVLLEAFDESDLERIGALDLPVDDQYPVLCGVNCRDLRTLEVNFSRFRQLSPYLPPGLPAVAESGIDDTADIDTVVMLGYRAALVGSALMRSGNPEKAVAAMRAAGQNESRSRPCS